MERRTFLSRVSVGLASFAGAVLGISYLKQLTQGKQRAGRKVKVGRLADFPVDTYTYHHESKVFIYRDHESVKAVSAICTHLGCTVQHTPDGFECPCHGSCYSDEGRVLSGPAPTDLACYRMERSADGRLVVDLGTKTDAGYRFPIA